MTDYDTGIQSRLNSLEDRVTTLENEVCLRGDTEILMEDGTVKYIKDIQYGDYVKAWDLQNNCYINAKTYGAIETGTGNSWSYYVFDNGQILEVFKDHGIYSKTRGHMIGISELKMGEEVIGLDGNTTTLSFVEKISEPSFSKRYTLATEANTYFANGILCANDPATKMRYYALGLNSYNKNITPQEVKFFAQTASMYLDSRKLRLSRKELLRESIPYYTKINNLNKEITDLKAKLAADDYKTIKYAEGQLSKEEFEQHKNQAQAYRSAINANQAEINTLNAELQKLNEKYHTSQFESRKDRWTKMYNMDIVKVRQNGHN